MALAEPLPILGDTMSTRTPIALVRTRLTPLNPPDAVDPWARGEPGPVTPAAPRAVFVDLDGTLAESRPYNVEPDQLQLMPHATEGLARLAAAGYRLIVVTHQPGIGYGMFNRAALTALHARLRRMALDDGVVLDDFYACPHVPAASGRVGACLCRVPGPGLLRQAARRHGLDLPGSWIIGDRLDDVEAGHRAGCRALLLDSGAETRWRMSPLREPDARANDWRVAAKTILAHGAQGDAGVTPAVGGAGPAAGVQPLAGQPLGTLHGHLQNAARWFSRLTATADDPAAAR